MSVISMKQLLEAGVHFGHQTRRWNPKMAEYIYTERNGIYIIDLQKSVGKVDEAYNAVKDIVANGGSILFVGTKKQAQDSITDPCGRLDRRRRPRSGLQRRRDRFLRPREKTSRLPEKPHGRLPGRTAADRTALDAARVEPFDRRQGGAGEQPAKHRRALSAGSHDLRHGRQRLGQVVARQGNPLPGTAAHALRHGNQTGRLRRAGRRRTTAQIGRNGRPEPDRKVDALESSYLHQSLR